MTSLLKTATLGCKVNQYETEYVREGLLGAGYRDALPGEQADLCVVNTCTVTREGDAKSRRLIRRLARQNPGAKIVVMGCYATRAPDEVARLPGVAEVVTDKRSLPEWLRANGVATVPSGITSFGNRQRAYIKVQDGCLLRCTYCIIPLVRPKLSSRPAEQIVAEAARLIASGHQEIVLTGVHLGHYGVDWNRGKPKSEWFRLADLLSQLVQLQGSFRIRLSSIEATEVTRELIDVMAAHSGKICPHLHICLQSGSDRILRRMRRRWGTRRFVDRCRYVQQQLDHPALTTDVLVGFPGETEEDFAKTCDVLSEIGFSKIHVFPFSAREGTPAATMDGHIAPGEIARRVSAVADLERRLRLEYFKSLMGRKLQVLVERPVDGSPDRWLGTSCRYAPVEMVGNRDMQGRLVTVQADQLGADRLVGSPP